MSTATSLAPARGVDAERGSPAFSAAAEVRRASSRADIDAALSELDARKDAWVALPHTERIAILDEIARDLLGVADRWVDASVAAKRIPRTSSRVAEEWGPVAALLRLVRSLRRSLEDIRRFGRPQLPGPPRVDADGQLVVPAFPHDVYDRILYRGLTAEIRLQPGTTRAQLEEEQAHVYRRPPAGKVALVLAAGNVSNLGPGDALYKLFSELQVVVLKTNPVNDYLAPLVEEAFAALVRRGFLRIVHGGGDEGAYLAHHPIVSELHLTGSDKTYEAIVFGTGDEGRRRKEQRSPALKKPFTCELGNLSPVIVVPGPWTDADVAEQAELVASMLAFNAGFNCMSTRVIVQQKGWARRQAVLDGIRGVLARTPTRDAYYPGAQRIHASFVEAHPEAERIGAAPAEHLPWTLISDVDPAKADDVCFTREAFCGLFAETALDVSDVAGFVDAAVDFCNERLWGTLTSTLLVHPRSLQDPAVAAAVERAVARLRYGTVGVNVWGAIGFLLGAPSWGAFPGHPPHDIQSGSGVVNNTLMLPRVEKTILRGPFRQVPKNPAFVSHATAPDLFRRVARFEAAPSPGKLPGILWAALRG